MSTTAHPSLNKLPRRSRRGNWLILAALVIAIGGFAVVRVVVQSPTPTRTINFTARPDLASNIDGLVIGSARTAPGVTAYVLGPRGAWLGAAGVANVKTGETIRPDARMRLESVSKLFTATLILQLDQEGKLHVTDTVERWLPGLLRSYGSKITIRELLTNRSGLISDSDLGGSRTQALAQLAAVKDTKLRAKLREIAMRAGADPTFPVDPIWPIRWAAWLPLLFAPGTGYHYSNVGYNVLGLIAERATGKSLSVLFQQHIFGPLGLRHTAYDPNGPIHGPHSHGYRISQGNVTDTTDIHRTKGADGGIVSNAQDTGTFLVGLMRGKLLDQRELAGMKGENLWRGGINVCGAREYGWAGEGEGYKTEALANGDGTRIAVLLLNAVHPPLDEQIAFGTASTLYCSA